MLKPHTFTVRPQDERPARRDGTCFYCGEPIGGTHKENCVIRTKTCVVNFTIQMVVPVPESWEKGNIEFHYNEGTWCADNLLSYIKNRESNTGRCLCNITTATFVRDATEADEEAFGYDPSKEE